MLQSPADLPKLETTNYQKTVTFLTTLRERPFNTGRGQRGGFRKICGGWNFGGTNEGGIIFLQIREGGGGNYFNASVTNIF